VPVVLFVSFVIAVSGDQEIPHELAWGTGTSAAALCARTPVGAWKGGHCADAPDDAGGEEPSGQLMGREYIGSPQRASFISTPIRRGFCSEFLQQEKLRTQRYIDEHAVRPNDMKQYSSLTAKLSRMVHLRAHHG
jgi:hypothetical protein